MTTAVLNPKTAPIKELKRKSKENQKENSSIEMSAKDEVKKIAEEKYVK